MIDGRADDSQIACAPSALVARAVTPAPDLGADTDDVLASLDGRPARKG
jgi:hypothetical protein